MTAHPASPRPRAWWCAVLALLVGVAALAAAAPAGAHSALRSTDPRAGSTVDTVPDVITMTFNQTVLKLGTRLEVVGPDGNVASGDPELVDQKVRQPLRAGSPAGGYTVRWRVTSADGHPISGTFRFSASAASAAPVPTATATPEPAATAGASPTATAVAAARASGSDGGSDGGGSGLLWIALGATLLAVLAGLVLSRRASRRADALQTVEPSGTPGG